MKLCAAAVLLLLWSTLAQGLEMAPDGSGPPMTGMENRIDLIRPDAPELAPYGEHPVGVRTLTFTDPGRTDLANTAEDCGLPPLRPRDHGGGLVPGRPRDRAARGLPDAPALMRACATGRPR